MEVQWSNRLWDKFVDAYYAVYAVNDFPDWVKVASNRYRSICVKWYGY